MPESLDSLHGCDTYVDAVLAHHGRQFTQKSTVPLYGMNLTTSALRSHLSSVPWNIDPARNLALLACMGVNVPTFYISGDSAYTPAHPEDGYLDSCNVIHWGLPGACKVWTCVHRLDTNRLMQAVVAEIKNWRAAGVRLPGLEPECVLPLHHKNWALSTDFLVRNGIRHDTVVQYPGDLVFVGNGVYHQVVNYGVNVAEAVNVGSAAWNLLGHTFTTCGCEGCAVKYICPNEAVRVMIKERDVRRFLCTVAECPFSCSSQYELRRHERLHQTAAQAYACTRCTHAPYATQKGLNRHIARLHSAQRVDPPTVSCEFCGASMLAASLTRHLRDTCRERPA